MKKYILLVTVSGLMIMCKKTESSSAGLEEAVSASDSIAAGIKSEIGSEGRTAEAAFDSADIKIKKFEEAKSDIQEKFDAVSKNIDSISEKIGGTELAQKSESPKDSVQKKAEKTVINVSVPKVIKETQVIYRDRKNNGSDERAAAKNRMLKTGTLEIAVHDAEAAKETVKEYVRKYDGTLRSENISLNNENRIAYLKVKVPIQKFEYLMDDLSNHIGSTENKEISVSGQDYVENTMCDLEISLYGSEGLAEKKETQDFGDRSFAALSSGWNVITSLFLFILPFWPLFLVGGLGYYFFRKKQKHPGE